MARVFLPPAVDPLSGGVRELEIEARTLGGLLRQLDARFPGLGAQLREGVAVAIDGEIIPEPWLEPVSTDSEVHFLPQVSGGRGSLS
ncbi:MAG: MoaD/ThiS family protein [Myxococcota bacterium]